MFNRPIMVGIVGVSGSGKTTIANSLVKKMREDKQEVAYLRADHYYKDVSHLSAKELDQYNFDVPDAVDMDGLHQDLLKLLGGKSVDRRCYQYACTSGEDIDKQVKPAKIIIVEGIFLLTDERIRKLFSLLFMVDTPLDCAIVRRIARDIKGLGNCDKALHYYESQLRPAAYSHVINLKKYAHHVLRNESKDDQKASIDNAEKLIKKKLQKSDLVTTTLKLTPVLLGVGIFAYKTLTGKQDSQCMIKPAL